MATVNAHVICDGCGDTYETDLGIEETVAEAVEEGWSDDDKQFCPVCIKQDEGGED